jgi:hypothetical protein
MMVPYVVKSYGDTFAERNAPARESRHAGARYAG